MSLLDVLAAISDPRGAPGGVLRRMPAVLLVSACAVPAGARSFIAVTEYAHDAGAGRARPDIVHRMTRNSATSCPARQPDLRDGKPESPPTTACQATRPSLLTYQDLALTGRRALQVRLSST